MSADVLMSAPDRSAVAERDVITRFSGEEQFLSNVSSHPVRWQDITYPTVEAAFQAGKTLDSAVRAVIAQALSPNRPSSSGVP